MLYEPVTGTRSRTEVDLQYWSTKALSMLFVVKASLVLSFHPSHVADVDPAVGSISSWTEPSISRLSSVVSPRLYLTWMVLYPRVMSFPVNRGNS